MARWTRGEAEIEQLLAHRELERVTGAAADGRPLLDQARTTAATAATLTGTDAYSAYILSYDAARFACTALLAQQGLRPTTSGGHQLAANAYRVRVADTEVMIADLADVIRSEEASGRTKDLQVLPLLYSHQATRTTQRHAEPGNKEPGQPEEIHLASPLGRRPGTGSSTASWPLAVVSALVAAKRGARDSTRHRVLRSPLVLGSVRWRIAI